MQIYEQLWREAMTAFELGQPQVDPHLLDKANDRRRGVSLSFWLPPVIQARIKEFLDQLAADFPGQYRRERHQDQRDDERDAALPV